MADKIPTLDTLVKEIYEYGAEKALFERRGFTLPQAYSVFMDLKKLAAGMGKQDIEKNPADFANRISGGSWKIARHLRFLADHLMKMERRELRRLVVCMPPRHGKSLLIDVYFPLWWLTRSPWSKVILAGYGEMFARKWGADVRDLLLQHSEALNLMLNPERAAADDWETNQGGGMVTVGVGGALTGRGADLLILDDPIKNEEEANSQIYRDRMWDWWQSTAFTRLNPNGVVVIVATRWHLDDLVGRLEVQNEETKLWKFISLPALALPNDPLGRKLDEPLWPEQFHDDPSYEIRRASILDYWWASLFQQNPVPEGGGIIKRDWFRFYHSLPSNLDQWCQSWDTALKDKATSDFTVGQVWARKGADIFLVDQTKGRFSIGDVVKEVKAFSFRYPSAVAKLIEDTAMGPSVKQILQHEVPGVVPVPIKGSRRSRVEAATPLLMAGNVYLPETEKGIKPRWVREFVEEAAGYPKAAHDDALDAFAQAASFLTPGAWRDLRKAEKEAKDAEASKKTPAEAQAEWFNRFRKKALDKVDRRFRPERPLLPRRW